MNPYEEAQKPWMTWTGRVLSGLVGAMLIFSAVMKLKGGPEIEKPFGEMFGYPLSTLTPIGILEMLVAVIYLIPKTRYLGGILVAAYLGGAVATHVRIGDVFYGPVILGVVAWIGLWLRDVRLRRLTPLVDDSPPR